MSPTAALQDDVSDVFKSYQFVLHAVCSFEEGTNQAGPGLNR